jgi:ABC-2 type transport system permease protein
MTRYAKLYLRYVGQGLKGLMSYRVDFWFGLLAFLLNQGLGILFIGLVFGAIPSLQGWSFYEVLFVYGFAQVPRGVDHIVFDNFWILAGRIIAQGNFDRYLLRPLPPLFQLVAERFQPDGIGELAAGLVALGFAAAGLGLSPSPATLALGVLAVIAGVFIYAGIKLVFASVAFWTRTSQSWLFAAYRVADFAMYPIGIYGTGLRFILTFALPFAFTAYFPAAAILGREDPLLGFGGTIVAGAGAAAAGLLVWRLGLRAYESAGN